jgi:hypothetical protein
MMLAAMNRTFLAEAIVANAILIPLLVLITRNYDLRTAYWLAEGFTPTTVRYPLLMITTAVKGSTKIPGLLSIDWQQVVALVLVLTDATYAWSMIKNSRRSDALAT